jgi:predicted DCC family thiol-disulfide oxidoreductase YuxK
MESGAHPIVLYDGVCGLCNFFVRFIIKRDSQDRFRFAALQSGFAAAILRRHGIEPQILDTACLVLNYNQPEERLLARNEAATAALEELGGIYRLWAKVLGILPQRFRDWRYNLVARNRYRIFGKYDTCPSPDPRDRHKFLD